jgi:2',3'-cyclic-nucleotide 2'-phosphodiesterase (5'-nucleotidase family)
MILKRRANGKLFEVIEWDGIRIGLIGLIEMDWAASLSTVDVDLLTVHDFIEEANEIGKMLKAEKVKINAALFRIPSSLQCPYISIQMIYA